MTSFKLIKFTYFALKYKSIYVFSNLPDSNIPIVNSFPAIDAKTLAFPEPTKHMLDRCNNGSSEYLMFAPYFI